MHIEQNSEGYTVKRPRRRKIAVRTRPPAKKVGDPTDDELLRYLDGAMGAREQAGFAERLHKSKLARARLEVLAEALEENGWPVRKPGRGST